MSNHPNKDIIFDLETFPNIFTMCAVFANGAGLRVFEISDRKNQIEDMLEFLRNVKRNGYTMVGFNNLGFDYPILHYILSESRVAIAEGKELKMTSKKIYREVERMMSAQKKDDRFGNKIKDADVIIPQRDLYLIWHMDNRARSTSLKTLEFNMRSRNIEDLPFAVGSVLDDTQKDVLITYNKHDVLETLKFYKHSEEAIKLREDLSETFGFDCTNFNDGKIGKQLFINSIEKEKPGSCYLYTERGRKILQTKRSRIRIKDCLVPYVKFSRPEFQALFTWFQNRVITETKGAFSDIDEYELGDLAKYSELIVKQKRFKQKPTESELSEFMKEHPKGWVKEEELKATEWVFDEAGEHVMYQPADDFGNPVGKPKKLRKQKVSYWGCWREAEGLNVVVNGVRYDYGLGGIHAAVQGTHRSDTTKVIATYDVASFYPNLSIKNNIAPAHLGQTFCKVYSDLYDMRKASPKGSSVNAALKLALNSSYGETNNEYSPLYDPQYTMTITCSGQMLLSMLIESVIENCDAQILMANTDGFEFMVDRNKMDLVKKCVADWEELTQLTMEGDSYEVMFINNVNNYISKTESGKVKLKGSYEHNDYTKHGWWKNHSAMVIAKAVEAHLVHGVDYEEFIKLHREKFDFFLRTKVPRSSKLVLVVNGEDIEQQNICRYYPSKSGGKLVKLMPPLVEGGEVRRLGIDTDYNVSTCNNVDDFSWSKLDYNYYVIEAKKLIDAVK